MDKTDEGLLGNEKIEDAIAALQQQPTQELLAHALTVVRRRMRENGKVIIAVEPNGAAGQMKLQAVKTSDGNSWWAVFTSFDEELKGSESVMSTFMTDIGKDEGGLCPMFSPSIKFQPLSAYSITVHFPQYPCNVPL